MQANIPVEYPAAFVSHKSLNLRRVESKNPLLLRVSKLGHVCSCLNQGADVNGVFLISSALSLFVYPL